MMGTSSELHEAIIDSDLPWAHLLDLIPLSDSIFIAGSAATWLAERLLFDAVTMWTPSDRLAWLSHSRIICGCVSTLSITQMVC